MIANIETLPQAPSTLDTRFFVDNGDWKNAPILKGQGSFAPVSRVRNILITGGAGFIASWLVRHLALTYESSYNIYCFDKLDYCASLNNIRALYGMKNFTFVCGDVTNAAQVLQCLAAYRIDTIFHFAAQSHVDLSFGNSYRFTETNVCGTHVLLEAAKEAKIRRFIHVSTDEVYGEIHSDVGDVLEEARLAPTNPYSASKAAAEMYVNAYWKSYKLPAIIVRMNNVYGPHQYPEKVIPKFACLLDRDQRLVLQGDGSHSRKYVYAGDVADAFDTILHKGAIGQIYNVDSDDEVSNLSLCSKLLEIFKLPFESKEDLERYVEKGRDRPFNDMRYAVDGSKLRSLGWKPKTSFKEGLEKTVEWYRQWGDTWWGDINAALTPFPVIEGRKLVSEQHDELQDLVLFFQSLRQELDARDTALKDSLTREAGSTPASKSKGWLPKYHRASTMEPGNIETNRLRSVLVVPVSLFAVWLVASLAPSHYEKVHERLPSLNVDWNPGQSLYNDSKLALMIEDRPLAYLTPLLLHMISVVPPDWPFLFVGSNDSLRNTSASITVQMHQANGKLELIEAPDAGLGVQQVITDRLLTNLTFYQQHVDPAEWLLVMHTDSILCARSEVTMNDWLWYDWVGGRWSIGDQLPGSGGLSLRRVSRMKQVLHFQDWQEDGGPEDRWFTGRIGTLPDANIPGPEVEARFCVQSLFHERPMGYHVSSGGTNFDWNVWQQLEQRKKIYEWCPEIKMILDMKLERERCTEEDNKIREEEGQREAEEAQKEHEEELMKEVAERKKLADQNAAAKGRKKQKGQGYQKTEEVETGNQQADENASSISYKNEATMTPNAPVEPGVLEVEDLSEEPDEPEETQELGEPQGPETEKSQVSEEPGAKETAAWAGPKGDPARVLTIYE